MTERTHKTALVLAGGGSLGAVQVGMLAALMRAEVEVDLVVGSSVGALNASFFAANPSAEGVGELAEIWRHLRRRDIFPVNLGAALRWLRLSEGLLDSSGLRSLIERHLPYRNLEEAKIPIHMVATNLGGQTVRLSRGPAVEAILASAAIPMIFPMVEIEHRHLMDGAVSGNTPILTAAELGATRIVVLPTGFACALEQPPAGAAARGIHALTLLVAHQMARDLARLAGTVEIYTAPSLCPLAVSPFDFSLTESLIARAEERTHAWIDAGGLSRQEIPSSLLAHSH
ncbi:MAG TPA: patatin-like phospholipase family protein [Caulobacteraceae bacterium]|nr:patatin-like phospholipase family protein [Caulobacteraceae bacterium]